MEYGIGQAADNHCHQCYLLHHQTVENRLVRRSRQPVHLPALGGLEGQGYILNTVGDQVQPEELDRKQREGHIEDQG